MKKSDYTFHFQISNGIKNSFFFIKKDYIFFFSNDDFRRYLLAFLLLLTCTILWGIMFNNSLPYLLGGLLLSIAGFNRVMRINYPQSLKTHTIFDESVVQKLQKNKKAVLIVLLTFLVGLLFSLTIFSILEWYAIIAVDYPQIFAGLGWFTLFLSFCLGIYYFPKVLFVTKKKLNKRYCSRKNRKIFLFFRKYPKAKKNIFICFLCFLSLFVTNTFLFFPFVLWSVRFNQGIFAYSLYVACLICALIVTLPLFQRYFFSLYSKNSLRMIGWNGPEYTGWKAGVGIFTVGIAYLSRDSVGEFIKSAVDREIRRREDLFEEERQDRHIQRILHRRQQDVDGAIQGKYPFPPMPFEPREPRKPTWPSSNNSALDDSSDPSSKDKTSSSSWPFSWPPKEKK